jgi:hypothetical protein
MIMSLDNKFIILNGTAVGLSTIPVFEASTDGIYFFKDQPVIYDRKIWTCKDDIKAKVFDPTQWTQRSSLVSVNHILPNGEDNIDVQWVGTNDEFAQITPVEGVIYGMTDDETLLYLHNQLAGRDATSAHPVSAIEGAATPDDIDDAIALAVVDLVSTTQLSTSMAPLEEIACVIGGNVTDSSSTYHDLSDSMRTINIRQFGSVAGDKFIRLCQEVPYLNYKMEINGRYIYTTTPYIFSQADTGTALVKVQGDCVKTAVYSSLEINNVLDSSNSKYYIWLAIRDVSDSDINNITITLTGFNNKEAVEITSDSPSSANWVAI